MPENKPRILIVGTQPYNKMVQSRAFDSYFRNWPKEKLAQVFSDSRDPVKGHCGTLYQITDKRLLKSRTNHSDPGRVFAYDTLHDGWTKVSASHKAPKKKTPLLRLLRKIVWKRRLWATKRFDEWLDAFKPEAVFLSFSQDFFIFDLAFYVASRFGIPIIASSADDYIFDGHFSLNPFYWIYRSLYMKTIKRLLKAKASWIFESPRIQEKYVKEFGVHSQIQYIGTDLDGELLSHPSKDIESFCYFGNLEFNRFDSICDVADAARAIKPSARINVYSKDCDSVSKWAKKRHPNIILHGQVPYDEVVRLSNEADVLLIVEGFKKRDVKAVRYSLSTKVADCLKTGRFVLAYGDKETGALDFLLANQCAITATSKKELQNKLCQLLSSPGSYSGTISNGLKMVYELFSTDKGSARFATFAEEIVKHHGQNG